MPDITLTQISNSELAQACAVHNNTIAAAQGAAHGLKSFEIPIPSAKPYRKWYFAAVVDDVAGYVLQGSVVFKLGGNPVLTVPVRLADWTTGWGQTGVVLQGPQVAVLPSWSATRAMSTDYPSNQGVGLAPIMVDSLTKGFGYNDSVNLWSYRVQMAPLRLTVIADSVAWIPEEYYGQAKDAAPGYTCCAVILAVVSDSQ